MSNNNFNSPKQRFESLLRDIQYQYDQWKRGAPTNREVADAVKSWNDSIVVLRNAQEVSTDPRLNRLTMLLDEALDRRDNRNVAIKSVGDAVGVIRNNKEGEDQSIPAYQRASIKAMLGYSEANSMNSQVFVNQVDVDKQVTSWVDRVKGELNELYTTRQSNENYINMNPQNEGTVYRQNAARVKSFVSTNSELYQFIDKLTPDSVEAIKSVQNIMRLIDEQTRFGYMGEGQRSNVSSLVRQAFDKLNSIKVAPRVKANSIDLTAEVSGLAKEAFNLSTIIASKQIGDGEIAVNIRTLKTRIDGLGKAMIVKSAAPLQLGKLAVIHNALDYAARPGSHNLRAEAAFRVAEILDVLSTTV